MPKLTVNGKEIEVDNGMTVLQACEMAGAEIPRFCYHERLAIAGNCRMCLVEVEKAPKPVASCAQPVMEGMVVHTDSAKVKKAREGVMEFLLINHPLDCPICDQGGECDLQDQSMFYGRGKNRYTENKRAVKDKNIGPLIKTFMTRCIHCTRCVRFMDEVAGTEEMGAVSRGENMEITTYVENSIKSELSGNIIDLCPVGALTSKPYAFKARTWELTKTESIDVFDGVGCNIRIDSRGNEVMRIQPRINDEVNEEWISDKSRFAYDGLKLQRIDKPYIRKAGKLKESSWDEAFEVLIEKFANVKKDKITALVGPQIEAESIYLLKTILDKLGVKRIESRTNNANFNNTNKAAYRFNTTISGIEESDLCLIIGADPRYEAPLVNTRLRKTHLDSGLKIANIGPELDLTYKVNELGNDLTLLDEILSGKNEFSNLLKQAKNPMIIVGNNALKNDDAESVLDKIYQIVKKYNINRKDWNGYNFLSPDASAVAAIDLGFYNQQDNVEKIAKDTSTKKIELLFLLNIDEIDLSKKTENCFVVYQGHHGDNSAKYADVILPGAAYTEKNGTLLNMEGRPQYLRKAVPCLGEAKMDTEILFELAKKLNLKLPFSNFEELRQKIHSENSYFANIDEVELHSLKEMGKQGKISTKKLKKPVDNFYMTDPISRSSKTMAECASMLLEKEVA